MTRHGDGTVHDVKEMKKDGNLKAQRKDEGSKDG